MNVGKRRDRRASDVSELDERYGQVYDPHVMRRQWAFIWPYRYGMGGSPLHDWRRGQPFVGALRGEAQH